MSSYDQYQHLTFDRPGEGLLQVTINRTARPRATSHLILIRIHMYSGDPILLAGFSQRT